MTDITDVKTLSNASRAKGQISERLIDELPQGVMAINSKGRILFANKLCRAFLGYKKDEFDKGEIYLTEFTEQSAAIHALASGESLGDVTLRGRDGTLDCFSLTRGFSDPTSMLEGKWAGGSVFLLAPYVAPEPMPAATPHSLSKDVVLDGDGAAPELGREFGRKLTDVIDAAPIGMAVLDESGILLRTNRALTDLTSVSMLPGEPFVNGVTKADSTLSDNDAVRVRGIDMVFHRGLPVGGG